MSSVRRYVLSPDRKGVSDLFILGERGTIFAIFAGLVISFLLCGYWYPYWRLADMDVMMAYQGLLVNEGHAQDFFDHPGHLSILLTSGWYHLFHSLGLLDIATISRIPPASNPAAFDAAWTQAVRVGRVLSLTVAMTFVAAFALLLRRLIRDRQVVVLATFCLAFSGGVMMNARTFRTDMLAAGLVTCGFLILLIAARTPGSRLRPLLVGLAATLCTLGIVNKVQALFLVLCLLPVVQLFGIRSGATDTFWRSPRTAAPAILALAACAIAVALPVGELIRLGLSQAGPSVPPPFGVHGLYQALIAAIVVVIMATFAWLWRAPMAETVGAMLAVAAGVSLGLLSLKILYHPQNVVIITNPIEHMFGWARATNPKLGETGTIFSGQLLYALCRAVLEVFARRTFVLHSSGRPTIFLEWLVIAGAVLALRRGHRKLVWQVAALIAVVWVVDTVNMLRGLKIEYFTYADPIDVIAFAWLLVHLPDLKSHRWAFATAIVLIGLHILLGQAGPVKHVFRTEGPVGECGWLPHYAKRIERFPFCPARP